MLKGYSHKGVLSFLALLILLFGAAISAKAQFRVSPVRTIGDKITCHVGGTSYTLTPNKRLIYEISFTATYAEIQEVFDKVTGYTALRGNVYTVPVLEDINVEICPGDVNYIAYNPAWLRALYSETKSPWALYAIIAHEIGHYVQAHDRTRVGSDPDTELKADEYAGGILAKMGACLADAQTAFNSSIMRHQRGKSHPPIVKRLAAVKRGWEKFGTCPSENRSEFESFQAYLKMDIDGRLNTIYLRPASDSGSGSTTISSSTSTSNVNSNSGSSSQSISDSVSGNTRRVMVNGDHVTKTFYLESDKAAEVNLWGQNIKLYISPEIQHRVRVNDRGHEVVIN